MSTDTAVELDADAERLGGRTSREKGGGRRAE